MQNAYAEVINSNQNVCGSGEIQLIVDSVSAEDRTYNASSLVRLRVVLAGVLPDDDVWVTGFGHMGDSNVGVNKLVTFSLDDLTINGEDKDKYVLPSSLDCEYTTVTISPYSVSATWEISGQPFIYNGSSFVSNISVFFQDLDQSRRPLKYSVHGYKRVNNNKIPLGTSDILLAGEYDLEIIEETQNANYEITSNTKTKTIYVSKATPTLSLLEQSFDYTGQERSLYDFVSLNNSEQTLSITEDRFCSASDLASNPPVITVFESDNYRAKIWAYGQDFSLSMNKAQTQFDFSNFETVYEYTGSIISLDKTKILVGNSEQEIYLNMDNLFTVGEYNLLVSTSETDNYQASATNLLIEVTKKKIDVSNFIWRKFASGDYSCTYDGNEKSVGLVQTSEYLLASYTGTFKATNAGIYVAKVSFMPVNNELYEVVGEVGDLVWQINKARQNIPVVSGTRNFVYSGYLHTLSLSVFENNNFYVEGNSATKAGEYEVRFVLRNPNNCEWVDGTTNFKSQTWTIEKAKLATPFYAKNVVYAGKEVSVSIVPNNMYYIVGGSAKDVGSYTTYLVLKDGENYSWADSQSSVLAINWSIVGKENYQKVPIVTLILVVLMIGFVAFGFTLRFTHIRKKRRVLAQGKISSNQEKTEPLKYVKTSASKDEKTASKVKKSATKNKASSSEVKNNESQIKSTTKNDQSQQTKVQNSSKKKEKTVDIKIQKRPIPTSLKKPSSIKKKVAKSSKKI